MSDKRRMTGSRSNSFEFEFDFDEWAQLQKDDPNAFEARRKQLVKEYIDSSPTDYRRRLQGLEFQMDMAREQSTNPMDACIKISKMMWDSFSEMRSALHQQQVDDSEEEAKVLTFPAVS